LIIICNHHDITNSKHFRCSHLKNEGGKFKPGTVIEIFRDSQNTNESTYQRQKATFTTGSAKNLPQIPRPGGSIAGIKGEKLMVNYQKNSIIDNESGNAWGEKDPAGNLYSQAYARHLRHTRISSIAYDLAIQLLPRWRQDEEELKEIFERTREIMVNELNHRGEFNPLRKQ
jgi:hypothetical protein